MKKKNIDFTALSINIVRSHDEILTEVQELKTLSINIVRSHVQRKRVNNVQ